MKQKKYCVKSVCFGRISDPARILVERYCEIHGSQKFSYLMRKLVIRELSSNKEFADCKKEQVIAEYQLLMQERGSVSEKMSDITKRMSSLGINPSKIILEESARSQVSVSNVKK